MTIIFTEPTVWVEVKVTGCEEDRWKYIFEHDADTESSIQLIQRASEEFPDAIVTFCHFTPTVDATKDIISTLPQAHDKELQKRVQEYHYCESIRKTVLDFLVSHWNRQPKEPLLESMVAIICCTEYVYDPSDLDEIERALFLISHGHLIEMKEKLGLDSLSAP